MDVLDLILAVAALMIAILAYRRAGGLADLKKRVDKIASSVDLRKSVDPIAAATDALRERMTEAIGKLEAAVRRKGEQKKPPEEEPPESPEGMERRLPPNAKDFQVELDRIFSSAQKEGKSFIEVRSGDLHRSVGGHPGPNHRIPMCCAVMKRNMKPGD
jgi:hypothetical protein